MQKQGQESSTYCHSFQYCEGGADQEQPTFLTPMNVPMPSHSQEAVPYLAEPRRKGLHTDQLFSKTLNAVPTTLGFFSFKCSELLSSSRVEGTGLSSSPHGRTVPLQGKGQSPSTRGGSTLLKSQFQPYSLTKYYSHIPTNYYSLLPAVGMQKGKRNCIHPCSCTDSRFCNRSSPLLPPFPETCSAPLLE